MKKQPISKADPITISSIFASYVAAQSFITLGERELSVISRVAKEIAYVGSLEPSDEAFAEAIVNMLCAATSVE